MEHGPARTATGARPGERSRVVSDDRLARLLNPVAVLRLYYAVGALLAATSAPAMPAGIPRVASLGVAVAAAGVALALRGRTRLPAPVVHAAIAGGAAAICLLIALAGPRPVGPAYAMFLLLVATYVALFLPSRPAAAHLLWAGGLFGTALVAAGHGWDAPVLAVLTTTALALTGFVVSGLVRLRAVEATRDPVTGALTVEGLALAPGGPGGAVMPVRALAVVAFPDLGQVSAAFGRGCADAVRRHVVAALTAADPAWTVARVDADSFAVAWHGGTRCAPGELDALGAAVLAALPAAVAVDDVRVGLEPVLGLAGAPQHGTAAEDLVGAAAAQARELVAENFAGAPDARPLTRSDFALLAELRGAAAAGQLRLVYQPLVGAHSGHVHGVEALLRWDHPTLGLLAPGRFLPLAERSGLVVELTDWVLDTALAQVAAWARQGAVCAVSVNVSPRCLYREGFADRVRDAVTRHGVRPQQLTVEITETAVVAVPARAAAVLAELAAAGMRCSIDDFGTGFTSLGLLRDLPVDEIKLDRSFVREVRDRPRDEAIARSVRDLGHRLGLDVVAEGVEDEATRTLLAEAGFDVLQGYHFARPVPPEQVPTMLATPPWRRADGHDVPSVVPVDEAARLLALHHYGDPERLGDPVLDDLAALAAQVCGTPVGLVTLLDGQLQWFVGRRGVDLRCHRRDDAFCHHLIGQDTGLLEVPDASRDERFLDNPLVRGDTHVRFYAGSPIVSDDQTIGSVCVLDFAPRTLSGAQRRTLQAVARLALHRMESLRRLSGAAAERS